MLDGFEWLELPAVRGGVLSPGDPGFAALMEEAEITEWIEAGAPPVEEWRERAADAPPAMPTKPEPVALPDRALTVNQKQAAALLGVHPDTFRDKVLPHLRVIQLDRRQLVPVRELERWVNEQAAYALRSQR